jgi:integrase
MKHMTCSALLRDQASMLWSGAKDGDRSMKRALRCAALLGETPISAIDTVKLDWLGDALAGEGLEAGSINRHLSALSKLLRWAHRRGALQTLPDAPWRKEPPGRTKVLTSAEVASVGLWFRHNALPWYGGFVTFLLETGMRCGEAHALRWEDVSQDVSLRYWVTPRQTKNGDPRSIPLSVAAYRAMRKADGEALIFGRVSRNVLGHLWIACREELNLDPELVVHSFRHSRASMLVNAGVPLAHIKEWLGHRDIKSTLRYAHTDRASLARALETMEALEKCRNTKT